MKLTPRHKRLLADILDVGFPYPLVLSGRYAVAHGKVTRGRTPRLVWTRARYFSMSPPGEEPKAYSSTPRTPRLGRR
ncbi:hypothetical protein CJD44_05800 [Streptomyces sp. alain-838]|nr:hypothetical protein CJD44_05800 [Streptomyces sp. alain-838]